MTRWARRTVGVAVTVALGACTGDREAASDDFCEAAMARVREHVAGVRAATSEPSDPRYGGTAVVGTPAEIVGGMNPVTGYSYNAVQHQQFVNGMTLITFNESTEPVPYLAESWDVAADSSEITFRLRRDVFWHDGERTDAYDVAFTYLRVSDPASGFPNLAYWDFYQRGEDGVEVVDSFTVKVRLRPHSQFMDPWWTVAMMPEHLLGDVPTEELASHPISSQCPVGNGPFVFVEHRPQDRWVFEANLQFPEGLGGRPFLDRLILRIIPEQATLLTELLTENIHIYQAPLPDHVKQILGNPRLDFRAFPFRQYVFVAWNLRRPVLADRRVRQAMTLGTNREEIVQALRGGYATVANSSVPPFHWAYDPGLVDMPYDPERAGALLDEAGWIDRNGDGVRENPDGVPLSFSLKYNSGNRTRQDVAEIMQAQLAPLGVAIQPLVVEWTTLLSQVTSPERRDFDGLVLSWVADYKVDDIDLFHSERSDADWAVTGLQNPEIDRLLEELRLITDTVRARPLWEEYQRRLNEEQPYTFFYFPDRLSGINRDLQGVVMDPRGEWVSVREWRLDPASRSGR